MPLAVIDVRLDASWAPGPSTGFSTRGRSWRPDQTRSARTPLTRPAGHYPHPAPRRLTLENVGPGLPRMRPHGDWIAVNGNRPAFSGFQMSFTGFTLDSHRSMGSE